jgi:5-methylcytosine-specific restriction protein A
MKFSALQKFYFDADDGAYSIVTADERKKSQITITEADGESNVVISAVGASSIPRKSAKATKTNLRLWVAPNISKSIDLTINFPKKAKNELRVYRNAAGGFNYKEGDIWFVFTRNEGLYIGSMPEKAWRKIGRFDADDVFYAYDIYEPDIVPPKLVSAFRHSRKRKTAMAAIRRSGFKCEVEPTIPLFTARSNGMPYLEPHHLIPVSLSGKFSKSLDHLDNLYALSPHHHRRIHFGKIDDCVDVIERLLHRRNNVLSRYGVTPANIVEFYNCNKIS